MRFSVIVPTPSVDPVPPALECLVRLGLPSMEILIVEGANPSHQRNEAAARACGDIIVFLDSDCQADAAYFERLDKHVSAGRMVLGGPILLQYPASSLEVLFQSLLAHPLLTGKSSSRYRVEGVLRTSDDSQLILCNMAVAREVFLRSGGFEERLYPNEENEWMARLNAMGVSCWYDPDLRAYRPQRKTWGAFYRMLTGYGKGRTKQVLVSGKWDVARQAPAAALLGGFLMFLWRPRLAIGALLAGWLGYSVAAGSLRKKVALTPPATLAAPLVPFLYALGQLIGFTQSLTPASESPATVYRWNRQTATLEKRP